MVLLLGERESASALVPSPGDPERAVLLRWRLFFATRVYGAFSGVHHGDRFAAEPAREPHVSAAWRQRLDRYFAILDAAIAGDPGFLQGEPGALDIDLATRADLHAPGSSPDPRSEPGTAPPVRRRRAGRCLRPRDATPPGLTGPATLARGRVHCDAIAFGSRGARTGAGPDCHRPESRLWGAATDQPAAAAGARPWPLGACPRNWRRRERVVQRADFGDCETSMVVAMGVEQSPKDAAVGRAQ